VTRYKAWDELIEYCRLSANPVGRLVLGIGGYDGSKPGDGELIRMSDATCTALQLTNHWQDVRRDLMERDRIYVPLEEAGIPEGRLLEWADMAEEPSARVAYIRAMRPLVIRTRELFKEGRPLPRALGNELTPVVWLFGAGGECVLTRIERLGCATLWKRPRLSKLDKMALIMAASVRFVGRRGVRSRAA
jgi:phytoene/squalene synthetase